MSNQPSGFNWKRIRFYSAKRIVDPPQNGVPVRTRTSDIRIAYPALYP